MIYSDLFSMLKDENISLWVENETLRFRAPRGALTNKIRNLIKNDKEGIIEYLRNEKDKKTVSHPLSHNQSLFWFNYKMAPESSAYNVAFVARVTSEIDVNKVRKAFQKLVDRHPVLRSTYSNLEGIPAMNIHNSMKIAFSQIDASDLDDGGLYLAVRESYSEPFNLEKGPIMRIALFSCSSGEHIILLTIHHIACDGWSIGILLDEFNQLYDSDLKIQLPAINNEYADYVNDQAKMLKGIDGDRLRSFWEKQLNGNLPELNLPLDKPRPPHKRFVGATQYLKIGETLYGKLLTLAENNDVTLYTVLLAVLQILLSRYSNQEEVFAGTPMANRGHSAYKNIVGCFINPVVLQGDLSGNPSFKVLLSKTKRVVMNALDNHEYPFPKVVENIHIERDLSRSPIFQVLFNLLNRKSLGITADFYNRDSRECNHCNEISFGLLKLKPFPMSQEEGQFDLALEMIDTERNLYGVLKYDTDLFDHATISRMADHFQVLLNDVIDKPESKISELQILSDPELKKILIEFNNKGVDYPDSSSLHQLIETQCELNPDNTAVTFNDESLSYKKLNNHANQLAHFLRSIGAGPNTLIGIYLDRSPEMIIGLYGILKSGSAYVPLDPDFPKSRLIYMMEHSDASILLTQESLKNSIPLKGTNIVCIDSDWNKISGLPISNPECNVTPDDLAYVIYTSGSTGKPKGVQVQHRAVVNYLSSMQTTPGITADDTILAITTISFDISVTELFLPLIVGAKTHILSKSILSDGNLLLQALRSSRSTIMQATPTTWQMLISSGWDTTTNLKVICGGEALPEGLAQMILARTGILWNFYGPTETTVWSTCYKMTASESEVLIGQPIANTTTYILDQKMNPTPIGVPGELFIGGAGVTKGYLKRPGLTQQTFIVDQFSDDKNALLYKTGDMALYLPDGNIRLLGRTDHQLKIRGYRVEPGEIESALEKHALVMQAIVIAHSFADGDTRLVSFVVPQKGEKIVEMELRDHLLNILPHYMLPSKFIAIEKMPLTPNKKVDRKALPDPDTDNLEKDQDYVPPRNETEKVIADIWGKILRRSSIDINDSFFSVGGNSILTIQLSVLLQKAFNKEISVTSLFQYPTIKGFADYITKDNKNVFMFREASERSKKRKARFQRRKLIKTKDT